MSQAFRFVLAMWDGGGTVPPELGVARRLIARGHSVHVLGDPTLEAEVEAAGCRFSPWTTAPHRTSRDRQNDLIRDYEIKNPVRMIDTYMREFLGDPAPRWAADTLDVLEADPPDLFIVDQALPAASIAAEKLGLPRAALSPQIWMLPTPGIPPLGPGFAPARGPIGRMRDGLLRAMTTRAFNKALGPINATRERYGLPRVGSTHEQILRVDATYVLTSPHFDFTSPSLPPHVFYAGPILDDPGWSGSWRSPWPADDRRPLVLVGFSSTFQNHVTVIEHVIAALASLPVRALVTLGPALGAGEVRGSDNVVVVPSAPHGDVLREASLLITHAGHGTAIKGLVAGVPLLCIPIGRDQNDTAVRVVERGAGLRLKPTASEAAIRGAVEALLRERRYRDSAQRLGELIATRKDCVDLIESLERHASRDREPQHASGSSTRRANRSR